MFNFAWTPLRICRGIRLAASVGGEPIDTDIVLSRTFRLRVSPDLTAESSGLCPTRPETYFELNS